MTSPLVTQEKLRSACSSTARGFEISRKSTCCGLNLIKVALGRDTLVHVSTDPSSIRRFCIIQKGMLQYPSFAVNSRTPQCVAVPWCGDSRRKSIGYSTLMRARVSKAEGGSNILSPPFNKIFGEAQQKRCGQGCINTKRQFGNR